MASLGGLHYGEKLNAKVQRNRQKMQISKHLGIHNQKQKTEYFVE